MKMTSVLMTVTTVAAFGCNMARDRGTDILIGSESFCPSCSIVLDSVATLKGLFLRPPLRSLATLKAHSMSRMGPTGYSRCTEVTADSYVRLGGGGRARRL